MKRFISISILTVIALPMMACAWVDTHNYYLFSMYDPREFSERVNDISEANWKAYLGDTEERWSYYDADRIIEVAKSKGDALMVSYVQNLEKYLECARSAQDTWNYPTKEEIDERNQTLKAVRTYALGKVKTRLRSQHALLYMRCNMMLGMHSTNVKFWEETASQFIETVYKDMMKDIYAGALLKMGRQAEAGELFAELGDWRSLMTQYYLKRSYAAIRQEYLKNPTAATLPFLLQDFVNNAQEADDATNPKAGGVGGKLFIRDISKQEAQQMIALCAQVVKEGKTQVPILWQTAKAWLEFMFGSKPQAAKDILAAASLEGTDRMKDNARAIMLYITASQAKPSQAFDDYVAGELQWLESKNDVFGYYAAVQTRVAHQVLEEHYKQQPSRKLALLRAVGSGEYINDLDTIAVERLLAFKDYAVSPATNTLDRYLKSHLELDELEMKDLIGTKYMRTCQWQKAIEWLQQVPLSYYAKKGYAPYAALRKYTVEPWITRQWVKDDVVYGEQAPKLQESPKLNFAKEMVQMEATLNVLSGKALQQRYYDLAVRYAQAHFTGDCWFLMRNSKSYTDELRANETDLTVKAREYLQKASQTTDARLKEKALFAMSYCYLHPKFWYSDEWNEQASEYRRIPLKSTTQFRAFAALADFEKQNAGKTSEYVSRCDEYLQFLKHYK